MTAILPPSVSDDALWDDRLIQKYNIQGPRYTSYPTAVQFQDITTLETEDHYRQQSTSTGPLSLYVHIPFCRHLCYYCGCNKVAAKNRARADEYLNRLETEMALTAHDFGDRPITQLHFGGGTPTFLTLDQMSRLLDNLRIYFNWNPERQAGEYSIELDPRETSRDMLTLLRYRGFNRLSFGIQDFNHETQVAIHRVQPYEIVEPLILKARELGFDSLNFDLIYGLPHQNVETLNATLDKVLELDPDRISLYNYAHLPDRFPAQRRITEDTLPTPDEKLRLMQTAINRLRQAGYRYIGMDHFARESDSLTQALDQGTLQRNFQGYSTQADTDMLALGVSGISQVGDAFLQNHADLEQYEQRLKSGQLAIRRGFWLNDDDRLRREIINRLSCQGQLDLAPVAARHGVDVKGYFKKEWLRLAELEADGLVKLDGTRITVTATGRLLLRPILMVFDAYLKQDSTVRYSKVV